MKACLSEGLLTALTALAITIGKGRSAQELGILAAAFTVLGDSLALLALNAPADCEEGRS